MEFKLEPLTPVFIGCNQPWNAFSDYILNDKEVCIIDFDKLIESENLGEKQLDDYVNKVKEKGNDYLIKTFLTEYSIDYTKYIIKRFEIDFSFKSQVINRTIKTTGGAYIPGSSIKGAIRTALLHELKKDKGKTYHRGKGEYYIGQDVFGAFENDVMKFFQVGDTDCFTGKTMLYVINNINLAKSKNKPGEQSLSFIAEMICPGEIVSFRMKSTGNSKIHKNLEFSPCRNEFDFLLMGNTKNVLPLINRFSLKNINNELHILEGNNNSGLNIQRVISFYKGIKKQIEDSSDTFAFIRLGGYKSIFDQIICRPKKPRTKYDKVTDTKSFYPVSRDYIKNSKGGFSPPGWVKISCL
jgi:CRISPR-associated protein Csm5